MIGCYKIGTTVGEGSFATVRIAINTVTGERVACKIVAKQLLRQQKIEKRFVDRVEVLKSLMHPNIINCLDMLEDDDNYYVILEYCENGSLLDFINKRNIVSEEHALIIMRGIIDAVFYLHSKHIAHRDLKPENIVFSRENSIKIIDFDFCTQPIVNHKATTPCGTEYYSSPSCMMQKKYDAMKNDIYSMGVILYAMVEGRLPWTDLGSKSRITYEKMTRRYPKPINASKTCADIIDKMLDPDEDRRVSIEWLRANPPFSNRRKLEQADSHPTLPKLKGPLVFPVDLKKTKITTRRCNIPLLRVKQCVN